MAEVPAAARREAAAAAEVGKAVAEQAEAETEG